MTRIGFFWISSTCLQAAAPPYSSIPQLTRLWNMAKYTVRRCWLDSNGFTVHLVRSSCRDEVDVKTSSLMVRRSITGTAVTRCSPVDQRGSAALMRADATLLLPSRCIRNYSTYLYGSRYSSYPASVPCLRDYVNSRVGAITAASVSWPTDNRNQTFQPYGKNVDYKCKQVLQTHIPIHNQVQTYKRISTYV